ncbi:MAG: hypothetical protein JO297_17570 [Nitrososphaeraceae archaeon]|nr:hypothetical protein [Nitrososphaeraceae archaeon]
MVGPSATQISSALESASTRYQKGYDDGCAGITVPGSHTSEYLKGYAVGAQACHHHQQQQSSLPTSPITGFPCVGGNGKNYCVGYHDGAVQADNDDNANRDPHVSQHLCLNHTPQYCQGYLKGYNDEVADLH